MLTVLLTFSTVSCVRTVEIPVQAPTVACTVPDWRPAPDLDAKADPTKTYVMIAWEKATSLGEWIGMVTRWHEKAQACIDAQSAIGVEQPAKAITKPLTKHDVKRMLDSGVTDIIRGMTLKGMHITFLFKNCGEVNGYYSPMNKTVTLCAEALDEGYSFARFIVAHEMAHAVIWQLDIPYTGSGEVAADELAAVVLGLSDQWYDVQNAANWFLLHASPPNPYDTHNYDEKRFVVLTRMAWGARMGMGWDFMWDRAVHNWAILLRGHRG